MTHPATNLTPWQTSEWELRKGVVHDFYLLRGENPIISFREIAKKLRISRSRLTDIIRCYEQNHDFNDLIPGVSSGRESALEKWRTALGTESVDQAVALAKGYVLDTGTISGSIRLLAKTGKLPNLMASDILNGNSSKHHIPHSLSKSVKTTSAMILAHQGSRALKHSGLYIPRRIDVLPGDIFVADDTTPIWGWWVSWPESKQYPFGKKVLQGQLLLLIDYASGYRIGYTLIAREKSSYRASDIWAWYGHIFDDIGLPRLGFQHEGGAWQAMLLRGQKIECEPGEPNFERRVGALTGLPSAILPYHTRLNYDQKNLRIWRSREARSKPVEGAFGMMQPLEAIIWGYLGTDQRRNPVIKTKRAFEACQRGALDPGQYFLSGNEMLRRLTPIMDHLNDDVMEGPLRQGKPKDWWNEALQKHPLSKLPSELRWLYSRNWVVRTLKGPFVDCSYKDEYSGKTVRLHYHNAELFARRCDERALVYFDKRYPTKPAQIVSLNNEWLGEAQYWSGTGAFLDKNEEGFEIQADYINTVMQLTKTIEQNCPSRQIPPEVAARRKEALAVKRAEMQTPLSVPTRSGRLGDNAPKVQSNCEEPAQRPQRVAKTFAEIISGNLPQTKFTPSDCNQTGHLENIN